MGCVCCWSLSEWCWGVTSHQVKRMTLFFQLLSTVLCSVRLGYGIWGKMMRKCRGWQPCLWQGVWNLDSLWGPLQPKPFYGSVKCIPKSSVGALCLLPSSGLSEASTSSPGGKPPGGEDVEGCGNEKANEESEIPAATCGCLLVMASLSLQVQNEPG